MTKNMRAEQWVRELGLLLADRAGLDPASTSEDWDAQSAGPDEVLIKMTTVLKLPLAEYNKLSEQAYAKVRDSNDTRQT